LSLRTLLFSNPDIERVRVYVVADKTPQWRIDDGRVTVEAVPDIGARGPWGYYWGNNKIHLCRSDADRVIYLDTDVMVLKPLQLTYEGKSEDLIARYGVETYMGRYWTVENWRRVLQAAGSRDDYPFYSPGFMVFQNGAHKRVEETWHAIIEMILSGQLPLPANKHAEMYAFSIAAAAENLTHSPMEVWHHRYAMIGESWHDAVVYHLGTPGFYRHYLPVEKELKLADRSDIIVPRPYLTSAHAVYTRVRHRLKRKLSSRPREASLEY
jgi:hypothetical protein